MVSILRSGLIWALLLLGAAPCLFAADSALSAEEQAFYSASEAFRAHFFERAEKECAQFVQQFPASPRVPEATLLQGQALIQQKKYPQAIQLLSASLPKAGKLQDQHLFWLAETYFRQGDFKVAADHYAKLIKEQPDSTRALEALIQEATARSKVADWSRVVDLFAQTNSIFQATAKSTPTNGLVIRGFLLLSEAQYSQGNHQAAEKGLQSLSSFPLHPALDWQRQYLLCRIRLAQGRPADALQITTNLVMLATNAAQPGLQAESAAFQAGVFERLARYDDAIAAYQRNLSESASPDRQRQALLKITELSIAQGSIGPAISMLERFATQFPDGPAGDLVLLTLGELRLRQHLESPAAGQTNSAALTNATESFKLLVGKYPQSPLRGKAQLNLGWCLWQSENLLESQAAFADAVQHLPSSPDLAVAYFKLADTQFRLATTQLQQKDVTNATANFNNALGNYRAIGLRLGELPAVKANLLERALYQIVQAGRAVGDLGAVSNALSQILTLYPTGFHTDRALLLAMGEFNKQGNPAAARELFLWATTNAAQPSLLPELELAIARTYEQENKWVEVMRQYESWLTRFTNHAARARAQYACAWASYQARNETNALAGFTNFTAQFPQHELAPLAEWWVADYYFRTGEALEAEKRYQRLFRSTNWGPSRLTYQAQLMAGRAAMARLGWQDVSPYFINLYKDTNCPTDLRIQALFCFGDYCISRDSTNKMADYDDAISAFNGVRNWEPTNRLAVLALGKIASCYLQKAQISQDYAQAVTNFQQVIAHPLADPTARSIAKVGLGIVCKKQAELAKGPEQEQLRKQALDHFLDVFYRNREVIHDGEQPDPFWIKKAGLEAAEMAEALRDWEGALGVYQQLLELLPQLRPRLEKSILKVQRERLTIGHR